MKILHSFLINAIYAIKNIIKFLFHKHDYTIVNRYIEYLVDHEKVSEDISDPLWKGELEKFEPDVKSYHLDIDQDEKITQPPECVDRMLIRIKYWYNNKIYKYLTYNYDYTWPPKKSCAMSFHIPLSSAQLLDSGDKPVKDILEKIRRYTGPHNDCYGEKIKISDIFYYDSGVLGICFPKIKLKNCFGIVKTVDTDTGYLTDLRIP